MSSKWLQRIALAAGIAIAPLVAVAAIEYVMADGTRVAGYVMMWLDGSGHPQPTTAVLPLPVLVSSGGSSQEVNIDQTTQGTTNGVVTKTGSVATTTPGPITVVALDVSSVTTGTTAVTALATGHAAKGGFLITSNSAGICIDQQTTAGTVTGTPASTICVVQNQLFNLVPNGHAVSVNSTASSVAFGGEGFN